MTGLIRGSEKVEEGPHTLGRSTKAHKSLLPTAAGAEQVVDDVVGVGWTL